MRWLDLPRHLSLSRWGFGRTQPLAEAAPRGLFLKQSPATNAKLTAAEKRAVAARVNHSIA